MKRNASKQLISWILICVLGLSLAPFAAAANADVQNSEYFFFDDFSGGNGKWKSYRGNALSVSDGVATASGVVEAAPADDSMQTKGDFELTVELTPPGTGTGWAGVMFNMASLAKDNWTKTGYMINLRGNGQVNLIAKGVTTQSAQVSNFKSAQMNKMKVEYTASTGNIKVYFNDAATPTLDVTDTKYTSGYFSITTQNGGKFDNYSVKCPWLFYDDFSSDLSRWQVINNTVSVSGGTVNSAKSPAQIAPLNGDGELLKLEGDFIMSTQVVSDGNWAGVRFNKSNGTANGNWAYGYFLYVRPTGTADFFCCSAGGNAKLANAVTVPNFDSATKKTKIRVEYTAATGNIKIFFNDNAEPTINVNDVTYVGGYTELILNNKTSADDFSLIGTEAIAPSATDLTVNYESKTVVLPFFDGYTTAIYSSSDENIVTLSGAVNTLQGGSSDVVLSFTDENGNVTYSDPIHVWVNGLRQEIAEPVKIASASDTSHHSAWPSSYLINGELTGNNLSNPECWSTAAVTVSSADVTLTLSEATTVTGVTLYPRYNNAAYFPKSIKVYLSADGSSWSEAVVEKNNITVSGTQSAQTYCFEPVDDVQYVKFSFESNPSLFIQLAEIEVLTTPAQLTMEEAAAALTVAQMEDKVIMNYPQLYTAEITACTPAGLVDGAGNITMPEKDTEATLTVKLTDRLDAENTIAVTRLLLIKSQSTLDLEALMLKTNLIPCPEKDATKITLPAVPEGYSVEIAESDHPEVVDLAGNIVRSDDTTYGVRLTLKITDTATGDSRLTDPLLVPIYKTFVAPTMTQAEIDAVHADWKTKKYGWFVHFGLYNYSDGSKIQSTDEAANNFDVVQFAKDAAAHGYEYVVFTVWHAEMRTLFPSMTNERWREDRRSEGSELWKPYSDRDVIDELITELDKYGIDLHLYTHPADGHDLKGEDQINVGWLDSTNNYETWNQYVNELYYEMSERYGTRLKGYWFDGVYNHVNHGEPQARLKETCKTFNPAMILTMNDAFNEKYTNSRNDHNCPDYHCWEVSRATVDYANNMNISRHQAAICLGTTSQWAAMIPQTQDIGLPPVTDVFRYLVAMSSVSCQGGYLTSIGYYQSTPDTFDTDQDLWLKDARQFYLDLNNLYIKPVKGSIMNTSVGKAFPTPELVTVNELEWGVSTESLDGKDIYFHVLHAPEGNVLTLPETADGTILGGSAVLMNLDGTTTEGVTVTKTESGYTVTLPEGASWDAIDTVIKAERIGYDESIPAYEGDKVFYDDTVDGFAVGNKVVREVEGQKVYLTVGENITGRITDNCFDVVDGVKQVYFLAREYELFHVYSGQAYAFYGAKAGINPNDPEDITKPSALRASDEGETVLVGAVKANPGYGTAYSVFGGAATFDGFTLKGNAKFSIGVLTEERDVNEVVALDVINCRNSTAEDAYAMAPATALIHGADAEHKLVNIKNNRFDGVCFNGESATGPIVVRNWEGVVEGNYISMKNSVTIGNDVAVTNIFWLQGESRGSKDWYGKQDVTIQDNYLEGRVSTSVIPRWYDDYKLHILDNTIAPTVGGYSLINIYTAGSATVDGETKYYSNIDTADIKISGNKVINPYELGMAFVNIYGTVTAAAADQVADINNYKAGNIKITHNELDYGTVSGNAFAGTAVTGYDNLVFDITCNKYGETVNPVKSGLEGNFAALNVADETAHKEVITVADAAPTETANGVGHTVCNFCGELIAENVVIPATGEAKIGEITYATLEEALSAAAAGQTVKLNKDVSAEYITVDPSVTLDLNGHALTAGYVIGFKGSAIIDGSEDNSGKLIVDKNKAALDQTNGGYLPVYEENGYIFTTVKLAGRSKFVSATQFAFSPVFETFSHEALVKGFENSNVNIIIRLTWEDEGNYRAVQDFIYLDERVARVIGSYDASEANYDLAFAASFEGSEAGKAQNVQVTAVVVSDTGVEIAGTPVSFVGV